MRASVLLLFVSTAAWAQTSAAPSRPSTGTQAPRSIVVQPDDRRLPVQDVPDRPVPGLPPVSRAPALSGWTMSGSAKDAYEVRRVADAGGCGDTVVRSKQWQPAGPLPLLTLWREADLAAWRGKRLKLSFRLRAGAVEGWAGAWVRVDGKDAQRPLAFDNMQNRPLRGTGGCEWHHLVVDVPADATRITYGVLLKGPGALWMGGLQLSEAPPGDVSTNLLP